MFYKITYPNNETPREIILTSSLAGVSLYTLLIIYQPFGTNEFEHSFKYFLLLPYALISALSFLCFSVLFKRKSNWTIIAEVFKTILALIASSILSYFYNTFFLSRVNVSVENYLYMFCYTAALGAPVVIIYILGRYIYLNHKAKAKPKANKNETQNQQHTQTNTELIFKESETSANCKLIITAKYSNINLEMLVDDFVFAEAADNYCIIYFYKNNTLKKEMIRISLSKLINQIESDSIKQIHRSSVVNLKKVIKFKGNSSGYKITLDNIENELSISRNYITSIVPILNKLVTRP
ncbi:MAG: LytTR family DNA-binding domain-containing protein [Candidatus Chryseobacterium colombiense]|nr:LytTR family DNA-binding domain-containing protein [Chryseobacterium sp.]WEK71204.1 MAG: LytTR family DNA-binding domain-containing protein [Chryseobacterium sp.]